MKITEDNYYAIFKNRQDNLFRALDRVEDLINEYSKDLHNWDLKYKWDFNMLHDLQDRIEDRLNSNYLECGDWNFKVHGMNIIDLKTKS